MQWDFGQPYKFKDMGLWNANMSICAHLGIQMVDVHMNEGDGYQFLTEYTFDPWCDVEWNDDFAVRNTRSDITCSKVNGIDPMVKALLNRGWDIILIQDNPFCRGRVK